MAYIGPDRPPARCGVSTQPAKFRDSSTRRCPASATHPAFFPMVATGTARHMLAWGAVGAIAQVAFAAGWLIADTWQRPRYSSIKNPISDLQAATAPHAWFPIACFAVGGLGTFGFAVFGLRPALGRAGTIAAYAPWMLAVAGLAIGNSFPLIPCQRIAAGCTAHVQLHSPGGMTDAIVPPSPSSSCRSPRFAVAAAENPA